MILMLRWASQEVEPCSGTYCGDAIPPFWSLKELEATQHVGWGPGRLRRRGSAFGLLITQLVAGHEEQATAPNMGNLACCWHLGTYRWNETSPLASARQVTCTLTRTRTHTHAHMHACKGQLLENWLWRPQVTFQPSPTG